MSADLLSSSSGLGEYVVAYLQENGWTWHEDRTWTHDMLKPANPHVDLGRAVSHQIMSEEDGRG